MTYFAQFFSETLIHALGWTFVHSLWQTLCLLILTVVFMKLLPARASGARYLIALGGLFLSAIASVVTFITLIDAPASSGAYTVPQEPFVTTLTPGAPVVVESFGHLGNLIDKNLPAFVFSWFVGYMFLSLRFVAGMWRIQHLRQTAVPITGYWPQRLDALALQSGVRRVIRFAESSRITSPIVVGILRPMILVPTGMMTGVSAEQLEAIILHELAHIRRHDYLVNLFQSLIESFLFFNPFIWILSGMVRREREYCCDDFVLTHHSNARSYARALTRLAEMRLARQALGVALGHDRNELLNRIRRIMEKSAKNRSSSMRHILPFVALITALMSISWMGTQAPSSTADDPPIISDMDTVPEAASPKERKAVYSRQSIITYDDQGQPHEEVVEKFEGDESLRPLVKTAPAPMTRPVPLPPIVHDTIPPKLKNMDDNAEWEAWSQELREEVRKQMEIAREHMRALREQHGDLGAFRDSIRTTMRWVIPDSTAFRFNMPDEETMAKIHSEIERIQREFRDNAHQFRDMQRNFEHQFRNEWRFGPPYERALRDELQQDGYLKEGEPIESMQWNDKSFKVNGKAVRKEHLDKYRELQRRYFGAG